jgi:4-amino-4-deoxy-L-arabinose transferase-like glycosyltransferase
MLVDRRIVGFAIATFALHLATIGLYGYHRDELYLLECGKHLAWGSIDHAPITPALSHLATLLFGESPFAQRVVAALSGAIVVALTGIATQRVGGGRRAQLLAMASVLVAPVFIFTRGVYATNAIELLVCVLATYLITVILDGSRVAWLVLGVVLGIGLLDKYTVLVFCLAVAVGVAATPIRASLRTPWPYVGTVLAFVVWFPNLGWQFAHDFPAVDFLRDHHTARLHAVSLAALFYQQPVILNPLTFAIAMLGLGASLPTRAPTRIFGIMFLVALAVFVVFHGKP